ncbi:class I SAM-dependent methyltransferase [Thalassospira tepidiphila]|uniref:class I SAM-dependent methyltransferase n=1 Tax=Thalassospira tepidiphila TaxID=393657 RepID=UPI003AA93F5A
MLEEYYNGEIYSGRRIYEEFKNSVTKSLNFLAQSRDIKGAQLLDIGCGEGVLLEVATQMGAHATGIEPHGGEIERLKERGFTVFHGLLEDFPIEEEAGQWDVITLTWVLDAMIDPVDSLKQIRRLLKPDGILHITIASRYLLPLTQRKKGIPIIWQKPIKSMIGRKEIADTHPFYFTRKSLLKCLDTVGFKVAKITPVTDRGTSINAVLSDPKGYEEESPEHLLELKRYFRKWQQFDRFVRPWYQPLTDFLVSIKNRMT